MRKTKVNIERLELKFANSFLAARELEMLWVACQNMANRVRDEALLARADFEKARKRLVLASKRRRR